MTKKRIAVIIAVLLLAAVLIYIIIASEENRTYKKECYFFDTYNCITVYSYNDYKKLDDVISELSRYDRLFDKDTESGDIYKINHSDGKPVIVEADTYKLLEEAYAFCSESKGAADITVAPLMDLWGFESNEEPRTELPSDSEINDALKLIDFNNVKLLGNNTVQLIGEGTRIDVGFIAKGYIADRIKEYMITLGIDRAVLSLGGNILAIGQKPLGKPYVIGIKDPMDSSNLIGEVSLSDESLVTSGTYERYITIGGVEYHHILDTSTGYPVSNGINGVTVKASSSAEADALSTICLILGQEDSMYILENHNAKAYFY